MFVSGLETDSSNGWLTPINPSSWCLSLTRRLFFGCNQHQFKGKIEKKIFSPWCFPLNSPGQGFVGSTASRCHIWNCSPIWISGAVFMINFLFFLLFKKCTPVWNKILHCYAFTFEVICWTTVYFLFVYLFLNMCSFPFINCQLASFTLITNKQANKQTQKGISIDSHKWFETCE